jgi:uncharacterized protein YutD
MNIVIDSNKDIPLKSDKIILSDVLNRMFLICREDKNFIGISNQSVELDKKISNLQKKIEKYNEFINKFKLFKKDIRTKLVILQNENNETKNSLVQLMSN